MACSSEEHPKAGILLGLDTQLTVPREIKRVGLYIEHSHEGRREVVVSQETETTCDAERCSVTFMATFAIQSGLEADQSDRIRSRFVGFGENGAPIAMREARTAVPTRDVRKLRLPLLFINAGRVEDTQAPGVAPSADAVGLRAETSANAFERFRTIGCGPEQTLGDDGECTSIDIPLESLPAGETFEKPAACFDAAICFGGENGVRELPVGQDCNVHLPASDGAEVAVGIRADSGYATGNADGAAVHPLDQELYDYDAREHVVFLKHAACVAAQNQPRQTVLVSVRCAPKPAAIPTCAPWQEVAVPAPAAHPEASFVGDPPTLPDAGPDAVVDSGPDAPEPPANFVRTIPVTETTVVKAFAARADGKAWFLVDGASSSIRVAPAGRDSGVEPARIEHSLPDITGYFELGANQERAYLVPGFGGSNAPFVVRESGPTPGLDPLHFDDCNAPAPTLGRITIGTLNGKTVAVYGGTPEDNSVGAVVDANDPACFVNPTQFNETPTLSGFYRGAALGNRFRVPGGATEQVLSFAPASANLDLVPGIPYPPPAGSLVYLQSLVATSPLGGILIAKTQAASVLTALFYDVTLDDQNQTVVASAPRRDYPGEIASREVFGAQGVVCGRFTYTNGTQYSGVHCLRLGATQAEDQDMDISQSDELGDIHVYGDEQNLYLAKLCWQDSSPIHVKVVTKPWSAVEQQSLTQALADCHSPPQANF